MYNTHQKQIEKWAKKNPKNTYKVIEFVIATANKRFALVPLYLGRKARNDIAGVRVEKDGFSDRQIESLTFLWENRVAVYKTIQAKRDNDVELMEYLVSLPSLGIPKAGFVAQLLTGTVGCIDVWNMRDAKIQAMLGGVEIPASLLTIDKKTKPAKITEKIFQYCAIVRKLGSEFLWDNWCATLADQYKPNNAFYPWTTAEQVSQFHVDTCIR